MRERMIRRDRLIRGDESIPVEQRELRDQLHLQARPALTV